LHKGKKEQKGTKAASQKSCMPNLKKLATFYVAQGKGKVEKQWKVKYLSNSDTNVVDKKLYNLISS